MLHDQATQPRLRGAGVSFQLVITKTTSAPVVLNECEPFNVKQNVTVANVVNPSFVDPADPKQLAKVVTPDIQDPDIQNVTVALAPTEQANVRMRVFGPVGGTGTTSETGRSAKTLFTGALAGLARIV